MTRRLIDLDMEVYKGMMTYPNVAKPVIMEMESHSEMARSISTNRSGVDEITNHSVIVTGNHIGTHIDSWGHVKPDAPRTEGEFQSTTATATPSSSTDPQARGEGFAGRHRRG